MQDRIKNVFNYCEDVRAQRDEYIPIMADALARQDRDEIESAVELFVLKHTALLEALDVLKHVRASEANG